MKKRPAAPRKSASPPAAAEPMTARPPAPPMVPLADIVGQDAAVGRLRQAMEFGRLPHALLFWGPAGVGKQTVARALAGALLCSRPRRPPDGCGQCDDCRMLAVGTHPDYLLVHKELAAFLDDDKGRERVMQDLSIDVIRQFVIAPSAWAPKGGRAKVFVVQDAELMNADAQNSLLKTLEEPPPGVRIILLTERAEEMLPTTRSRCSLVRFGPLPTDFVVRKLREAGVADEEARFWAAFSGGSAGEALRLAAERLDRPGAKKDDPLVGLYMIKRGLLPILAAPNADTDLAKVLIDLAESLAASAATGAKAAYGVELGKQFATRQGSAVVLQLLASVFRDALRVRCAADGPAAPLIHADQPREIEAVAARFGPDQLADVLEQLAEYERLLWRNVNPKVLWDNAAITLASAAPMRL